MAASSLANAAATVIAAETVALQAAVTAVTAFKSEMEAALEGLIDIPAKYNSPARNSIQGVLANLNFPMQEIENSLARLSQPDIPPEMPE